MTAENMKLWNDVKRVPPEHLKGFTRGGGFKGTAIKPMWSIQTMTEQFGPIGIGWGVGKPEYTLVPAGNEILVFCNVAVWIKDRANLAYGVGGDKVLVQYSSGFKSDDEAYKKAFTDAITNALKFFGVGADIHMGLWDGNKYVDEQPEVPKPPKVQAQPEYKKISDGIKQIMDVGTSEDLRSWFKSHVKTIEAFPPDWHDEIMAEFTAASETLKEKAA